jgi:hypothetical protein
MAAIFQIRRGSGSASTLADGELYFEKESGSLQVSNGTNNPITLVKLNQMNSGSLHISGNIKVGGDVHISGNLFLGNQTTDSITATGEFTSNLIPNPTDTYNLGSDAKRWGRMFINSISASAFTGSLYGMGDPTSFSTSVDSRLDYLEGPFSTSVDSRVDLLENAMSGSNRLYVSPQGTDTTGSVPHGTEHNPFKTIKAAVASLGVAEYTNTKRYTIFVGSGNYTEENPIAVPPGVAIIGDNLRTVRLTAANPTKDYFHCHEGNYFYGLRFLNLRNPSFCFSYPCSTANATISGGSISTISVVHSMTGYTDGNNQNLGIIIEGPDISGSIATATANVVGGVITQINVVTAGTNYSATEKPYISIPAPLSKRPIIGTSPYIQNCSSITGPFTTDGTLLSLIPGNTNYAALPYNINDVRNASNAVIGSGVIDEQGAGGGIRIDGNLVHPSSPLESFVADAFTQVNQGGPGHLVINNGYAQFVSCFTTFCTYGFKVANGGFANISNSVIDFGAKGLISKTYFPQTYNTGSSLETKTSAVSGFVINENGAGYTGSIAGVTITGGGASVQATAQANVNANGSIDEIILLTSGSGYTTQPNVTIAAPTGAGAIQATTVNGKAFITGVTEILMSLQSGSRGIDISSNMILNGVDYLVTDAVAVAGQANQRRVTTYPAPPSVLTNDQIQFHQLSNISTGGLVMEYGGSGVTYNALPKFGGVPIRTREINEFAPGRVFYSTVDNIGNLKIGDFFAVNQLTGEVTIDANSFNLAGLNTIGPFKRNSVAVGVVLQEVSNNTTLLNSQGLYGEDTVPTQFAVKGYVDAISASLDGRLDNIQSFTASISGTNAFTASTKTRLTDLESTASNHETRITDIQSYTSSLKTAIDVTGGNTRIIGNLIVDGTQTSLNTTETFIEDKSITLASGSTTSGIADGAGLNIAGANVSMSWEDSNQRLYFNTNIGVSGSISASINGIGNVSSFSQSVATQFYTNVTSISGIQTSITNLNVETASIKGRLDNLESKSASVDIKISNLNTFTASLAGTNAFTTSINTKFDAVGTYTSSVESKFSVLQNVTASLNNATASLYTFTASISGTNAFTASALTTFTELFSTASNHEGRLDGMDTQASAIGSYTSSIDSKFIALGSTTSSLLAFSSSFNPFSQSVDARLDQVEYTASISVGAGLAASFTVLNQHTASMLLYTGSANARLSSLETTSASVNNSLSNINGSTGSYATTGSNSFNGSQQITGSLVVSQNITGSASASFVSLAVNTITPTQKIHLKGAVGIENGTTGGNTADQIIFGYVGSSLTQYTHKIQTGHDAQAALNRMDFQIADSASTRKTPLQLRHDRVIISGSTYVAGDLSITGSITATGDITAYFTSDNRHKNNIQLIPNALQKIEQLNGVTWEWNDDVNEVTKSTPKTGLIAQEVQLVLPEVVKEREDGFLALDYSKMMGLMVEAIKDLKKEIEELKKNK